MRPVQEIDPDLARQVDVFLTDIDDTLTTDGRLPKHAYAALWDLHDAGISVVPVTGRPAGWCDLISRQWPVAGVIGENGAFVMAMHGKHQRTTYNPVAPEPSQNAKRLDAIASELFERIPGTRYAKDQFARLFDVAIDFREEPPLLGYDVADEIRMHFESHGAQAKVSSIHVNAWFGAYDKRSMAAHYLRERFDLDLELPSHNARSLFVGDSPNDEPMFETFRNTVGVANIVAFSPQLQHPPRFVTSNPGAEGFAELVEVLLHQRS
ncbi:MAG: HAD family hydrolase [Spirochaetota bacterium]